MAGRKGHGEGWRRNNQRWRALTAEWTDDEEGR